jgi:hypothetical protein
MGENKNLIITKQLLLPGSYSGVIEDMSVVYLWYIPGHSLSLRGSNLSFLMTLPLATSLLPNWFLISSTAL